MVDKTPKLPKRDLKIERAIGRFIIAWGALEREIDSAIHDLLLTSLSTGVVVTANLAIRAKLDLAHALFENLRAEEDAVWLPVSKEWEQRFDALINKTAKANSDSRNPIVHGQPVEVTVNDREIPFFMTYAARKGGWRGSMASYSKSYLDEKTDDVVALTSEWAAARDHWELAIRAIRSADADAWLGRSPDDQDHLTLQFQTNRTSPKPRKKQASSKKPQRPA